MKKKHDVDAIKNEFEKGFSKQEVSENLKIPYSSLSRYIREMGIEVPAYIQSEETRQKRSVSLKKAHELDPTLKDRQTKELNKRSKWILGKTFEEIHGNEKGSRLRILARKNRIGKLLSEETKEKIRRGNLGKTLTKESRLQISMSRKEAFRNGTLKLSYGVGVGKGGFREDIGHYVRSTYEHYYAQQLKAKGIRYFYEARSFAIEIEGKKFTFTPDFYLVEEKKWVEIKNSYNVKNSLFQKKLEAFHSTYPTEKLEIIVGERTWIPS